ncbi:NAD-dependent epimerase/dehydratase family protein [Cryptosporangium phraense]|uniref:NAD-dependent epimerase/dehydratase family protein n=1 Tax=Cryptosporangium phraense TaxID=2593070 RepID=A0A545AFJ3_9ACTN|nr:NAD-dependent epimerase/dehydratase family protein [Cryptosporangium phraense]
MLITGATGRIGELVVDHLTKAGTPTRALVHRSTPTPHSLETVTGDLTVPDSLNPALHDIDTVFLVWTAPPQTVPAVIDRIAHHARRIVFLSSPHQTPHPFFQQPNPTAALHAEIERRIADSTLESTILRPGMFASNAFAWWEPAIRSGRPVRWPYATAETAPVADRDVAAVAARALLGDVTGDSVLTGPESLTQAEQVAIIAEALGREVTFEELSPDEFRRETAGSWPAPVVEMLLAAWEATLGRPAFLSSGVSDVLGTAPRSFRRSIGETVEP